MSASRLQMRADIRRRNAADYDDGAGLRLTKSQEDSGVIASACFLVTLVMVAVVLGLKWFGIDVGAWFR